MAIKGYVSVIKYCYSVTTFLKGFLFFFTAWLKPTKTPEIVADSLFYLGYRQFTKMYNY